MLIVLFTFHKYFSSFWLRVVLWLYKSLTLGPSQQSQTITLLHVWHTAGLSCPRQHHWTTEDWRKVSVQHGGGSVKGWDLQEHILVTKIKKTKFIPSMCSETQVSHVLCRILIRLTVNTSTFDFPAFLTSSLNLCMSECKHTEEEEWYLWC